MIGLVFLAVLPFAGQAGADHSEGEGCSDSTLLVAGWQDSPDCSGWLECGHKNTDCRFEVTLHVDGTGVVSGVAYCYTERTSCGPSAFKCDSVETFPVRAGMASDLRCQANPSVASGVTFCCEVRAF